MKQTFLDPFFVAMNYTYAAALGKPFSLTESTHAVMPAYLVLICATVLIIPDKMYLDKKHELNKNIFWNKA